MKRNASGEVTEVVIPRIQSVIYETDRTSSNLLNYGEPNAVRSSGNVFCEVAIALEKTPDDKLRSVKLLVRDLNKDGTISNLLRKPYPIELGQIIDLLESNGRALGAGVEVVAYWRKASAPSPTDSENQVSIHLGENGGKCLLDLVTGLRRLAKAQ